MCEAVREALCKLDTLFHRRSLIQEAFHESVIADWAAHDPARTVSDIIEENLRTRSDGYWGRTTAVAMFVAALMWTQPATEISMHSVSRRTATLLLSKVFLLLRKLSGGDCGFVVAFDQEELTIKTPGGGTALFRSLSLQQQPARRTNTPQQQRDGPDCGGQC